MYSRNAARGLCSCPQRTTIHQPSTATHAQSSGHPTTVQAFSPGTTWVYVSRLRCPGASTRRPHPCGVPCQRSSPSARTHRIRCRPAFRQSVDAQHVGRHAFLSAGKLYDEVQPQAARTSGAAAGIGDLHPYQQEDDIQGMLEISLRAAGDAGGDRRTAGRLAAAGRRCSGRVRPPCWSRLRTFADRGEKRHQGPLSQQCARHEPGQCRARGFRLHSAPQNGQRLRGPRRTAPSAR